MTDSTVQRYTQFDKSLIDDVKEFFQNGTISHAQALSLCPLEPSEQVLYVNASIRPFRCPTGTRLWNIPMSPGSRTGLLRPPRMTNGREDELARLERGYYSRRFTPSPPEMWRSAPKRLR